MRILIASNNEKKRAELLRFVGTALEPITPAEAGIALDPDETGATFAENARIKALAFSTVTPLPVLADDSGLEVDALRGAPGIRSARFAGRHGDDAANRRKLLAELADLPPERRGARFVCALCLARGGRVIAEVLGECRGRITHVERGTHGFGYDSLFFHEPSAMTFAEMNEARKSAISHRAMAILALRPHLESLTN